LSHRTAYRHGDASVVVETEDYDASRWLAEFVTPWFEPCAAPDSVCDVRFTASQSQFESIDRRCADATTRSLPCFGLDSGVVYLSGWTESGVTIVADPELASFYCLSGTGVDVIARPQFPRARIGWMRVVRELLIARRQATDRLLDLHAAAFAAPAGAVLIAGPKHSGKTTLLTHFLRCGRGSLIANDRLLVDVDSGLPTAYGVPVLVSLRGGTLEWFPELRRSPGERPAAFHSGESASLAIASSDAGPRRNFGLSPAQLAQRCGSATTSGAPIAAIVFPEVDATASGCSIEPLAIAAGSTRLLESRYGVHPARRSLTIFEAMASAEARRDDTPAQVACLSAAVPLFRCRLGRDAYRNDALDLLDALNGGRAQAEHAR
jgi:hypothetical protein